MPRPLPLDLFAEVVTADGTRYRWDANQPPGSRPQNLSFRTKIGEGFSDASLQLARRIDLDYADLNLVDGLILTGADGSVAYEGRVEQMPRDLTDTHVIGMTFAGWMAHAKDRMFQEIYDDRDTSQWGEIPIERRALLAGTYDTSSISWNNDRGGLACPFPNQQLGTQVLAESFYASPPGCGISGIGYRGLVSGLPAGWVDRWVATTGRDGAGGTGILSTTLDDTLRFVAAAGEPYGWFQLWSIGTAATPASGSGITISKVAVYGNHGLTRRTGDPGEPDGFYVSDILKNVAGRFCPMLDTSGVQTNTYVVQHCAYRDPITPYDAFLDLNKYALWHLGVWDNRQLVYRPYDLTDYQWEIRTDDQGTDFSFQGETTDSLFNGIAVTYTDPLTGVTDRLTPSAHPELTDASSTNPWNTHGIQKWDEITLSTPTLAAQALLLGQAALAERNRPKTPGTITVQGYIRDRAGNPQPAWKVRAGDTISITNFPNDRPRLIVESSYDDETKTVQLSIDAPFAMLDAYLDRLASAVSAAGLA